MGPAAAEDLAQDTLLTALESPPAAERPLRPWLVRVVHNAARMRFRAERRRIQREDVAATTGADAVTPETAVHVLETHRTLCELVLALDEPLRRTIVGHYFEGLTLAALGRRDGVVADTIRWRHARALTLIREGLDQRAGGDRRAWLVAFAPISMWPTKASVAAAGGTIMNKLAIAALVASVSAAGGLWWRHASSELRPWAAREPDAGPAHGARPAAADGGQEASAARAPGHVIRMVNAGERRRELADQIAAASARRVARAASAPDGAAGSAAGSGAMDSPEQVLTQMLSALKEVHDYVSACVDRSGTAVPGFKAELVLTGDPDVGTLIDASALVSMQGEPLDARLDDCVREVVQTLELPPMALGKAFKVSYEFTFDDEPK